MENGFCQEKPTLVNLLPEPKLGEVIQEVISTIKGNDGIDVMLDFSNVGIIRAENLGKMLILRRLLEERKKRLVLTKIAPRTFEIFRVTRLDEVFNFVNDGFAC